MLNDCSCIIHAGGINEPRKPRTCIVGRTGETRRQIKQLRPVGQHLPFKTDDLQILERSRVQRRNPIEVQVSALPESTEYDLELIAEERAPGRRRC